MPINALLMANGETVVKVFSLLFGLITKKLGQDVDACSVSDSESVWDGLNRLPSLVGFPDVFGVFVLFWSMLVRVVFHYP